jgi:hypothetical protein
MKTLYPEVRGALFHCLARYRMCQTLPWRLHANGVMVKHRRQPLHKQGQWCITLGLHMVIMSNIWKIMNIYVYCTESGSLRIWLKIVYTCVVNYLYSKYNFYQPVVTKDSKSGRKQWNKLGSHMKSCYWKWGLCVYKVAHHRCRVWRVMSPAHAFMAWCLIKHGDSFTFVPFFAFMYWQ